MRLFFILLCILSVAACQNEGGADDPGAIEAGTWRDLDREFRALVTEAKAKKDPAAIQARLEKYLLTEAEFLKVFGPEVGPQAWPGYRDTVVGKLKAEGGAVLLREIIENGRDEVWVERVGPAFPARTTEGDKAMREAMPVKLLMRTVKLRKKPETLGIRLNGFLYIDGQWRSLFKTYNHFANSHP